MGAPELQHIGHSIWENPPRPIAEVTSVDCHMSWDTKKVERGRAKHSSSTARQRSGSGLV